MGPEEWKDLERWSRKEREFLVGAQQGKHMGAGTEVRASPLSCWLLNHSLVQVSLHHKFAELKDT